MEASAMGESPSLPVLLSISISQQWDQHYSIPWKLTHYPNELPIKGDLTAFIKQVEEAYCRRQAFWN